MNSKTSIVDEFLLIELTTKSEQKGLIGWYGQYATDVTDAQWRRIESVAAGSDVATERSGSAAAGSYQDRLSLGAVAALFWAVENGV